MLYILRFLLEIEKNFLSIIIKEKTSALKMENDHILIEFVND